MPRETLDREIHQLQDEILTLGSLVEQNMLDAMQALRSRDKDQTQRVYQADTVVNQKRFAIESATLLVIATQQPMAHDLTIAGSNSRSGKRTRANWRLCEGHRKN